MSSRTKILVKGYAKTLRADATFARRTATEITELALVVAKHKHPELSFEPVEAYVQAPKGHWTLARCTDDAKRFKTRAAWKNGSSAGYDAALRGDWLDLCCEHMELGKQRNGFWTLERCHDDAKRFDTRGDWMNASPSGYATAHRNGWLESCCAHMSMGLKPRGYWTLDRCRDDAKRFETRTAWKSQSGPGYAAARKAGWLDLCCAHMTSVKRPGGYWTRERCLNDAQGFPTRRAWCQGSPSGYNAALIKGWLEDCCAHMTSKNKPHGYWSLERCREDAKRFQTRGAWQKGSRLAYDAAYSKDWLDLCCGHMPMPRNHKKRKFNQ
jgi:hypothetical protein